MVGISTPLSIWMQIASMFFTLSGIHSDLLIIRFFLFSAYVMLFINALAGSPLWPDVTNTGYIPIDGLFWSCAGLYVHGASLLNLILDERPVQLSDDEEALWRLFYRTGGLSARLFKNIVSPYVKIVTFEPGQVIPTEGTKMDNLLSCQTAWFLRTSHSPPSSLRLPVISDFFYILYKGEVLLRVYGQDGQFVTERATMNSGHMFDMKYLGMFTDDHFFLDHSIACTSITASTLFCFSRDDMKKIAQHHLVKSVWQSLIINNLSSILEKYVQRQHTTNGNTTTTTTNSKADKPSLSTRDTATDRIFRPLEPWELPPSAAAGSGTALQHPFLHFWNSLVRQFSPPWQHLHGIRQTNLSAPVGPPEGDEQSITSLRRMTLLLSSGKQASDEEQDQIAEEDVEA